MPCFVGDLHEAQLIRFTAFFHRTVVCVAGWCASCVFLCFFDMHCHWLIRVGQTTYLNACLLFCCLLNVGCRMLMIGCW